MLQKKPSSLVATGLLTLAAGLGLHIFVHERYSHFAAGFLIGMSIVFIVAGFVRQSLRRKNAEHCE